MIDSKPHPPSILNWIMLFKHIRIDLEQPILLNLAQKIWIIYVHTIVFIDVYAFIYYKLLCIARSTMMEHSMTSKTSNFKSSIFQNWWLSGSLIGIPFHRPHIRHMNTKQYRALALATNTLLLFPRAHHKVLWTTFFILFDLNGPS